MMIVVVVRVVVVGVAAAVVAAVVVLTENTFNGSSRGRNVWPVSSVIVDLLAQN